MKKNLIIKMLLLLILLASCKTDSKTALNNKNNVTATSNTLPESKKNEIVEYYLINKRKLPKRDFYKIVFLNDNIDNVKVINYKGKDAFFTFKFSDALQFYNSNH